MTCYNHLADEQAKADRKTRKHQARRYFLLTLAGAALFYLCGCVFKPSTLGAADRLHANPVTAAK